MLPAGNHYKGWDHPDSGGYSQLGVCVAAAEEFSHLQPAERASRVYVFRADLTRRTLQRHQHYARLPHAGASVGT
jgi:hypothetical protein